MASWKLNGKTQKAPGHNGLTFKPEKIWGSKAGRGATGKFVGDLVAIKMTAQLQVPKMTPAEVQAMDAELSQAYIQVTYPNPRKANQDTTGTFYAGTPTYPVYSWAPGIGFYQGVAVDLVEV